MTKCFGQLTALADVSVEIAPGEIHCLLGENGAGKSTLCNLVFGVHRPDGGAMRFQGEPYAPGSPSDALASGVAMVHQHFSLVPDMTVVDNLLLGQERGFLRRGAYAERLGKLSRAYKLALEPFAKIGDLSVGERQRVEIVKCLMREPRLLVLDEPTAVLLPDEIEALYEVCRTVAAGGCGIVLVTHKLAEVRKVADRVTVLRGGAVVARSENPDGEIDRLVRAMIQRDVDPPAGAGVREEAARPEHLRHAPHVFQADGLTVVDQEGAIRLDNFTLEIRRGEIVGVAGVEGNGQSELAAVLSGTLRATSGRFFVDEGELTDAPPVEITAAGVAVVPEDRHAVGCIAEMTVTENVHLNRFAKFTRFGILRRGTMRAEAEDLMRRFDVRAASPDVAFSTLSGGNQQKAVLARELTLDNLCFLVAAQPTRGLDIGAVNAVYGHIRAACARGAGVLLISSELDDLFAVAHEIIVLYRGRIMGRSPADPANRTAIGAMMAGHVA